MKNTEKMFLIMELYNYIKSCYAELDDLCKRLQDDYNSIKEFEQCEEDRLIIYNILEYIDELKESE